MIIMSTLAEINRIPDQLKHWELTFDLFGSVCENGLLERIKEKKEIPIFEKSEENAGGGRGCSKDRCYIYCLFLIRSNVA